MPLIATVGECLNYYSGTVDSYEAFYCRVVGAPCLRNGEEIALGFLEDTLLASSPAMCSCAWLDEARELMLA